MIGEDQHPPTDKDEFYAYDKLSRLTSFDRGQLTGAPYSGVTSPAAREEDFTLDKVGNWTDYLVKTSGSTDLDQDRTHNKANEISGITEGGGDPVWIDPAYDAAGNTTTMPQPGSPTASAACTYDAWNRLVKVSIDANTRVQYYYDGRHQLIHRALTTDNGSNWAVEDYYYNASWQMLERYYAVGKGSATDLASGNDIKAQYVWSARYIDAQVLRDENKDPANDDDCDDTDSDERLYYCQDANFNVTALVGTDGTVLERYVYDPYGKVSFHDGSWNGCSSSGRDNAILYCGYRYDSKTGLYQVRHRVHHPALGRWMQRDRTRVDGMNLYQYARSSPQAGVDPFGTQLICNRHYYALNQTLKDIWCDLRRNHGYTFSYSKFLKQVRNAHHHAEENVKYTRDVFWLRRDRCGILHASWKEAWRGFLARSNTYRDYATTLAQHLEREGLRAVLVGFGTWDVWGPISNLDTILGAVNVLSEPLLGALSEAARVDPQWAANWNTYRLISAAERFVKGWILGKVHQTISEAALAKLNAAQKITYGLMLEMKILDAEMMIVYAKRNHLKVMYQEHCWGWIGDYGKRESPEKSAGK